MRKNTSSNSLNQQSITGGCPITSTFAHIGGRWKVIILWQLKEGPLRYNELFRKIPNISEKMLTQQLKELSETNWILKTNYQTIPPHTDYRLSALGISFIPILQSIYAWGMEQNIIEMKKPGE